MVGRDNLGSSGTERGVEGDCSRGVSLRVSPRDLGEVKTRTCVAILVSHGQGQRWMSSVDRRNVSADIQAAKSSAVEVMAVLETVGWHSTRNATAEMCAKVLKDGSIRGLGTGEGRKGRATRTRPRMRLGHISRRRLGLRRSGKWERGGGCVMSEVTRRKSGRHETSKDGV